MEGYIKVYLSLNLNEYVTNKTRLIELPIKNKWTVKDVIKQLQLPENEAVLITVNGHIAQLTTCLKAGDQLKLFPIVMGG